MLLVFVGACFNDSTGSGGNARRMYFRRVWPQLNGTFHLMHSRALTAYNTLDIINMAQITLAHTLVSPVNFKLFDLTAYKSVCI